MVLDEKVDSCLFWSLCRKKRDSATKTGSFGWLIGSKTAKKKNLNYDDTIISPATMLETRPPVEFPKHISLLSLHNSKVWSYNSCCCCVKSTAFHSQCQLCVLSVFWLLPNFFGYIQLKMPRLSRPLTLALLRRQVLPPSSQPL